MYIFTYVYMHTHLIKYTCTQTYSLHASAAFLNSWEHRNDELAGDKGRERERERDCQRTKDIARESKSKR